MYLVLYSNYILVISFVSQNLISKNFFQLTYNLKVNEYKYTYVYPSKQISISHTYNYTYFMQLIQELDNNARQLI